MRVEDLDGNVLRLGSDSLAGQPFGEWLDMHGPHMAPVEGRGQDRGFGQMSAGRAVGALAA